MELEEMKTLWQEMTATVNNQKKLTDDLIIKMTNMRYKNSINKIWLPEALGTAMCWVFAIVILINIRQMDTWYLLLCGSLAVIIFCFSPLLSLLPLRQLKKINVSADNYKQTLAVYSKNKLQFIRSQKINFYLCAVLMLVILPVLCKIFSNKDIFINHPVWLYYVIAYPFFHIFTRWIFKHYKKTVENAEEILKDLEE